MSLWTCEQPRGVLCVSFHFQQDGALSKWNCVLALSSCFLGNAGNFSKNLAKTSIFLLGHCLVHRPGKVYDATQSMHPKPLARPFYQHVHTTLVQGGPLETTSKGWKSACFSHQNHQILFLFNSELPASLSSPWLCSKQGTLCTSPTKFRI